MNPPHAASLVQVSEASLCLLTADLLQPLAALASHPPPVLIRPLLLVRFAFPVARAAFGFGDIAPYSLRMQILQCFAAMIALVSHYLFHPARVNFTRGHLRFL